MIALKLAEAAVERAQATAQNAEVEAERRRKLTDLAVTKEEQQTYDANATAATAQYHQAVADRDQAQVNLDRTQICSPVNGWVTNLLARVGDCATVGRSVISVVDADSFWVDAYLEETQLAAIREGDPAKIKLMGYSGIVQGTVTGTARGINVSNARADEQGLATVNPISTWVRLAQRAPMRINIDHVPEGWLTATVQVDAEPSRR